jgi:hypothetical protein
VQLHLGLLDAEGIVSAAGAQPVGDDLLHRLLDIMVVDAVPHPRLPGKIRVSGQEPHRSRIMCIEVFDDDCRLGNCLTARLVPQHRHLRRRPDRLERRARSLVAEID